MLRFSVLVLAVASCLAFAQAVPNSVAFKQLSGPPEEFASHSIPNPLNAAVHSSSSTYLVDFTPASANSDEAAWTHSLDVDSATGFAFALFSPLISDLNVELVDPAGAVVPLAPHQTSVAWPFGDTGSISFSGLMFVFEKPVVGIYKLEVSPKSGLSSYKRRLLQESGQNNRHGYLILYNDSPDQIYAHLSTYDSLLDNQVGIVAQMSDMTNQALVRGVRPTPLRDVVLDAELDAMLPDGTLVRTPMHDDGQHNDLAAGDGIYGGSITVTEVGLYTLQAQFVGTNKGGDFMRSSQHVIQVVPQYVTLKGAASATPSPVAQRVNILLEVSATNFDRVYRGYCQLWGTSTANGQAVPVAWASALGHIQKLHDSYYLPLEVDLQWVARAHAVAPFTLKDVWVQDIETAIPLTKSAAIHVSTSFDTERYINKTLSAIRSSNYNGEITKVMREGVPPAFLKTNSTNGGKIVVSHGYCAKGNPFTSAPGDWTDVLFFADPLQGRSHDAFAQQVVKFAESQGLSSFSFFGHSQGGIVGLHLMNYYHSGLDAAGKGRKIQSLASPFLGNTGMSTSFDLMSLFGAQCDFVNDMTVDGANLWLSGISSSALAEANYYTTAFDKGGLFGKGYCNMAVNLVLDSPNDGVTEQKFAELSGATNRGHTVGQCHVDGMNWPASYFDHERNKEVSATAAR